VVVVAVGEGEATFWEAASVLSVSNQTLEESEAGYSREGTFMDRVVASSLGVDVLLVT
jgi:hypothetical protein